MQDLYLKFDSQDEAQRVLFTVPEPYEDAEGALVVPDEEPSPLYLNIDQIGVIYEPTGETIEHEGFQMPVMQALPGWHVNIRLMPGEDAAALTPFLVTPTQPRRVWA